jgi:hypothetical protein
MGGIFAINLNFVQEDGSTVAVETLPGVKYSTQLLSIQNA